MDGQPPSGSYLDQPFLTTFFRNFAAQTKAPETLTLRSLAPRITTTTASSKTKLPWLKLAEFGDLRTDQNCLRHDANLLQIHGVEADYDQEQMPVSDAVEKLEQAGIVAMVYTSPSHTRDAPRWRVLCPTSVALPPTERDQLLARVNGVLEGVLSGESWTLSQSYYYGSINQNPSHQVELIDGTPIDLRTDLDATAIGNPRAKPAATAKRPVSNGVHAPVSDKRYQGYCRTVLDTLRREAIDGEKHNALLRHAIALGGIQADAGFTDDTAVQWLMDALPSTVKTGNSPSKRPRMASPMAAPNRSICRKDRTPAMAPGPQNHSHSRNRTHPHSQGGDQKHQTKYLSRVGTSE
jgi:hypothetical protein